MNGRTRCRGTALSIVLVMMSLVAAAVAALTVAFAAEAHRTRIAGITAQQRQLLLAATVMAGEELQAHGTAAREVSVSTPVDGAEMGLSITPSADGTAVVVARCRCNGLVGSETLTYRQSGGGWRLSDARLRLPP